MRIWKLSLGALAVVLGAQSASAAYDAERITPQDVAKRQSKGEAITIVDVRTPSAYAAEHIYGAANIPKARFEQGAQGLPKSRTILLYCT